MLVMSKTGFSIYKAKKGLIKCRVEYDPSKKIILKVDITGDFFLHPEDSLSVLMERLKGVYIDRDEIAKVIKEVFNIYKVSHPGIEIDDFVKVIYESTLGDEGA